MSKINNVKIMMNYEYKTKILEELTGSETRVYDCLYLHANIVKQIFRVYPSLKTIQEKIKLSIKTIIKCLKALVKKGYINIGKQNCRSGHHNLYDLCVRWKNEDKFTKKAKNKKKVNAPVVPVSKIDEYKVEDCKEDGMQQVIEKVNVAASEEKIEISEELKIKIDAVRPLVNQYHEIGKETFRLLDKLSCKEVIAATEFIVKKNKLGNNVVAIKFLNNALKMFIKTGIKQEIVSPSEVKTKIKATKFNNHTEREYTKNEYDDMYDNNAW